MCYSLSLLDGRKHSGSSSIEEAKGQPSSEYDDKHKSQDVGLPHPGSLFLIRLRDDLNVLYKSVSVYQSSKYIETAVPLND